MDDLTVALLATAAFLIIGASILVWVLSRDRQNRLLSYHEEWLSERDADEPD